jgi:predicted Fe-S protein YdhL (DUF1289 family)
VSETRPPPIESPCLKICTYEPAQGQCAGCLRTLDEIARWGTMSREERRQIMRDLPERRRN